MKLSLRTQRQKCYQFSGKMRPGNYRVVWVQGTSCLKLFHRGTVSVNLVCSQISVCRMALCAFWCGHSETHPGLHLCSSLTPYFHMLKITRYWEEHINIHDFILEFNDNFLLSIREKMFLSLEKVTFVMQMLELVANVMKSASTLRHR